MKGKTLFICLVLVSVLIVGIVVAVISTDMFRKEGNMNTKEQETNVSWVIASEDELLGKYETGDKPFTKRVFDDAIGYWHSRRIDDALVEGDYIRYLFDRDTKELIEKDMHWRDDLPEHLPEIITKEEAESIAKTEGNGKIMNTNYAHTYLCYISPDSHRYPIEPTPKNPCWIVYFADKYGYNVDVIIVDAVEGKILGVVSTKILQYHIYQL